MRDAIPGYHKSLSKGPKHKPLIYFAASMEASIIASISEANGGIQSGRTISANGAQSGKIAFMRLPRKNAVIVWPRVTAFSVICLPRKIVPPMTRIFMVSNLHLCGTYEECDGVMVPR